MYVTLSATYLIIGSGVLQYSMFFGANSISGLVFGVEGSIEVDFGVLFNNWNWFVRMCGGHEGDQGNGNNLMEGNRFT